MKSHNPFFEDKMKRISFEQFGEDAEKMFNLCWTAFNETYPRKAAGFEQVKLCNKVGRKMEAISFKMPKERQPYHRTLEDNALLLEDMELEKLLSMVRDEQIGWLYESGKDVERLVEALEAAPKVEVEERKDKADKTGSAD